MATKSTRFITAGQGGLLVQEAADEAYWFLTAAGIGAITLPRPDKTSVYEPGWAAHEFRNVGFISGEPGNVSCTLNRPLDSVANWLLEQDCPFNLKVNIPCRGARGIHRNFDMQILIFQAEFESGEITQPIVLAPGDNERVEGSGDIVGRDWSFIYTVDGDQQEPETTTAGYAVTGLPPECESVCGDLVRPGEIVWAALVSGGYLAADSVIWTSDFGANWEATAGDPFEGNRNCLDIITIPTNTDVGYRVIVAGGADPGHHAEISYSDDEGATWTDVEVGEMNNQAVNALALDGEGRLWAVCSTGHIHRSDDAGDSWTLVDSAAASDEDLNDIIWLDEHNGMAVGANNTVVVTTNGGTTWGNETGPSAGNTLNAVGVNYAGHYYVVAADDVVYRSADDGENWSTVKDFNGGGDVIHIDFEDDMLYGAWIVRNDSDGDGHVYRSIDGGVSWNEEDEVSNSGFQAVWAVDMNECYVVGDAHGGITFVGKWSNE